MRAIWDIAINQLRLQLSERGSALFMIVMPVAMMIFLGSAINGAQPAGQVIDVVGVGQQDDPLTTQYIAMLRAEGSKPVQEKGNARYIVCDLSQPANQPEACKLGKAGSTAASVDVAALAKQRQESGDALAYVTIPAGFPRSLQAGQAVTVGLESKAGLQDVQAIQQFVQAVSTQLGGLVLGSQVVTQHVNGDQAVYQNVYETAQSTWAKDPVQIDEQTSTITGTQAGTGFGQSAPGIGAMFVLMSALTLGEVFVQERKQGTLQRILVLPLSRAQLLAGKLLGQFLVCAFTFAIMIVAGTLFGVHWGDWLAVVVVVIAFTLAVTAMGLAFSTLVRTAGQAAGIRLLVAMILAPLGGAWWTLSIVPAWMRAVGQISPIYWSQDAFTKMIFYGAHLSDVLPSVGVLLLFAVVFFAFGITRFRYE